MITVECVNGVTHVTFPTNEVPQKRLDEMIEYLRQPQEARVTTVEPLPRAVWERIYSQADEFAFVTAEQMAESQVREEPR